MKKLFAAIKTLLSGTVSLTKVAYILKSQDGCFFGTHMGKVITRNHVSPAGACLEASEKGFAVGQNDYIPVLIPERSSDYHIMRGVIEGPIA